MAAKRATTPAEPTSTFSPPSQKALHVSKNAIVWISLLGALGLTTMAIALFFLLRYQCTRAARDKGHHIADGRNEHKQWWKHANPPVDGGVGDASSSVEMAGLAKHAAAPGTTALAGTRPEGRGAAVTSRYYGGSDLRDEHV